MTALKAATFHCNNLQYFLIILAALSFFLCQRHGLGGLVIKDALIAANSYQSNGRRPHLAQLSLATIGVLFLGTPHRGSDADSEALGVLVGKVASISGKAVNDQLLASTARDSHVLEKQRNDFTTISSKGQFEIVCFYEEIATLGVGMVVEQRSAACDGFDILPQPIRATHIDMVKFSDEHDPGYRRVVQETKKNSGGEQGEASSYIKASLHFESINARKNRIYTPYGSTFKWVLKDGLGFPGLGSPSDFVVGKSRLMKYVRNSPLLEKYLKGMLRSILWQLIDQEPQLAEESYPRIFATASGAPKPPIGDDWDMLKSALTEALAHANIKGWAICVLIDGLDEYRNPNQAANLVEAELETEGGGGIPSLVSINHA
ncbi:hypothetical protein B0H63DRAFT_519987 [Podospora didyma]|uniref:Nephrocystin 3-like N-terminal domain-containing protein n=1 Tax=Podospora didyma TaxID=330526 RepID=A0AAE0U4R3_9PEZI|nr:hypothetical protein B0H63DRAFT_519987 [Podospora didyma]